ncbi:Sec1-binding region of Mso1-domain-containing protein [Podospora australis]|uniref:Sec1-binding region of Mso1-domain-containing protein n=1 Tax=Podospora australis TaxID=1536484 RepID=A0AAN6WWU5_9PEZI|nr:Sec1-binding region of Mso1-domain-containing protein [Podospora australis]
MSAWYNNFLTNASTNITKLQRTYFAGESDGDTEDDTHVCRVLRNYYTEKGQPFPGWLPPDPKAPPPTQPVYASQQAAGSRYGGFGGAQTAPPGAAGGGLSKLWDNNNNNNNNNAGGGQRPGQQQQQGFASSRNPFAARDGSSGGDLRPQAAQGLRTGSYQQAGGRGDGISPTGSAASGTSAQEKLKQRLWGGGARTTSPSGSGPFQPPQQQQQAPPPPQQQGGSRWGWNNNQGAARGGSGDAYGSRQDERPVMSANAPWADGGFDYPSGGGGGGGGGGGRSYGLPSGPRGGLPSGPRPR